VENVLLVWVVCKEKPVLVEVGIDGGNGGVFYVERSREVRETFS